MDPKDKPKDEKSEDNKPSTSKNEDAPDKKSETAGRSRESSVDSSEFSKLAKKRRNALKSIPNLPACSFDKTGECLEKKKTIESSSCLHPGEAQTDPPKSNCTHQDAEKEKKP